jgi:perosamine synthetase
MIKVAVPLVDEEEIQAAVDVLRSGNYTSGPIVEKFEEEFASYIGTKYAVACNSGTAALHMTLLSLGIGPGDEVIVPAMSFFATMSSVMMVGADPVFCDVGQYANINIDDIEKHITPKTKAIIPVHFFGTPCNIVGVNKIAKKYNLHVIEDCAQAHGATWNNKKVGSFGIANCFSFFATKNITTVEGGIITTDNEYVYEQCKLLRSHGMPDRDHHSVVGYNYRMNEVFAAIGRIQLQKLDKLNEKRIVFSKYFQKHIVEQHGYRKLYVDDFEGSICKSVYFWFPIVFNSKYLAQKGMNFLKQNGIEFRYRYNEPLYKQPVFRGKYNNVNLSTAESLSGCIIGLPNHPKLTLNEVKQVVDTLNGQRNDWI